MGRGKVRGYLGLLRRLSRRTKPYRGVRNPIPNPDPNPTWGIAAYAGCSCSKPLAVPISRPEFG